MASNSILLLCLYVCCVGGAKVIQTPKWTRLFTQWKNAIRISGRTLFDFAVACPWPWNGPFDWKVHLESI